MPQSFTVLCRNPGHWDIISSDKKRLFRLRGGPGHWDVIDERTGKGQNSTLLPPFKEQTAAMSYICSELMHELLTVKGQTPHCMEAWNIGYTSSKDPMAPQNP